MIEHLRIAALFLASVLSWLAVIFTPMAVARHRRYKKQDQAAYTGLEDMLRQPTIRVDTRPLWK